MNKDHNFFFVESSSKPKAKHATKSKNAREEMLKEEDGDEELGV